MRSQSDPLKQITYVAARRFVEVALRHDGSLFEPDRKVWSAPVLDDLYQRFNLSPDESKDRFEDKFRRQLKDAPTATIQLAAELIFVHLLIANDITAPTKKHLVDVVRSLTTEPIEIPSDLEPAFAIGVCNTGIAFKTYRPFQLWLIIDFMRAWKELSDLDRERHLSDPWMFKEMLESIPQRAAQSQRQGLLHLVFPDTFEDMVSQEHKKQIIAAFREDVPQARVERRAQARVLETEH